MYPNKAIVEVEPDEACANAAVAGAGDGAAHSVCNDAFGVRAFRLVVADTQGCRRLKHALDRNH